MFGKVATKANERIDNSEKTMLRLSDNIGKMSDRIGEMSNRILEMNENHNKNTELMQKTMMESINIMGKQMDVTNKLMELLIQKG